MNWLKALFGATVITGVAAYVAKAVMDEQKRREELDEFLVADEEGPVEIEIKDKEPEEEKEEVKEEETKEDVKEEDGKEEVKEEAEEKEEETKEPEKE